MAFLAGVRLRKLDEKSCEVSVPMKFLTKNPFKSMYFAVQSMAAEFSTALLLVEEIERSKANLALIIVSMKADFTSRAQSRATFTCRRPEELESLVSRAIESGEAEVIEFHSTGRSADGEIVSEFSFKWSVKRRS